jgi:hypothetical protein
MVTESNTLKLKRNRALPWIDKPDPKREKLRVEREDPKHIKSKTDARLWNRVELRTDKFEPMLSAPRTESPLPKMLRSPPWTPTESADPIREKPRSERLLPQ